MIDVVMYIAVSFGHFVGWVVILAVLDHAIRLIKLRKMVKKLEGSDFKKKNEMQGSGEMTEFHGVPTKTSVQRWWKTWLGSPEDSLYFNSRSRYAISNGRKRSRILISSGIREVL